LPTTSANAVKPIPEPAPDAAAQATADPGVDLDRQGGWLSSARAVHSPNFGPRPAATAVELVIVHSISLPPGEVGGDAIERLFTNTLDWDEHPYYETIRGLQVSAHFLIRRDGSLLQFVSAQDRAWHAGQSAWRGRDNCNDWSLGIELEGLSGSTFEPAQYAALADLLRAVARLYPIKEVVGHEHVAPGRKDDPGPGFDWTALMQRLDWPAERFPAAIS
jgi:AmpD protein